MGALTVKRCSRHLALHHGRPYYFEGTTCRAGHIAPRVTATRACTECLTAPEVLQAVKDGRKALLRAKYRLDDPAVVQARIDAALGRYHMQPDARAAAEQRLRAMALRDPETFMRTTK